jgi:hypothetical protein
MEESMTEWLVRLDGQEFDLDHLTGWFSGPDCDVERREDGYYLKCSSFDNMIVAADVLARATDVVEWLNGLGRMESAGFRPISAGHVVRVHDDGRRNFFVICRGEISIGRGRLSGIGYVVRPDGRISSEYLLTLPVRIARRAFESSVTVVTCR